MVSSTEPLPRSGTANGLAATALGALVIAYLLMFSVLGETAYASKFENGELPAGFDPAPGQFAAVGSVVCGVFAVVGMIVAMCLRTTKLVGTIAILGRIGIVPFALLAMITWQLAF